MKHLNHYKCGECKPGLCFPVPVSRLEQSLGHEKFECNECHAQFKITPAMLAELPVSPFDLVKPYPGRQ